VKQRDQYLYSKITFLAFFGLILFLSFRIAASFLVAVLMGGLIAHALRPVQRIRFLKSLKRSTSAYIVFIGLIFVVVLPLTLFGFNLIQQGIQFRNYLSFHELPTFQSLIETLRSWPLVNFFIEDPVQLQNQLRTWVSELGAWVSSIAMSQASEIPSLLIQLVIVLISCLVFLIDGDRFIAWLSARVPLEVEIKNALIRSFSMSSKSAVWATLAASGVQAIVMFFGFLALNVQGAVLAAGTTFIFAFIPFLGAVPVWIVGALYLYVQGSLIKVVFMVVIGLTASLTDNVVRAIILKGPSGLHPLVGVIAVFGGMQLFGFFGVLIGPIIAALLITMSDVWPQVWEK
jgi:predicted PurR-regulated permease PerM